MSTGRENPDDAKAYENEIPPVVPYFDPAGVYYAEIMYKIEQVGRMEDDGSGNKEYKPFPQPVKCGGVDKVHYDNLPVDGAQIVTIVMIKALQDVQVGGMITRTPIGDETHPDAKTYEAILQAAQRPTLTPEQLTQLKGLMGSK